MVIASALLTRMAYDVDDKEDWVLSEFIDKLKQPPSKLRIYVLYQPETLSVSFMPSSVVYYTQYRTGRRGCNQ